MRRHYRSAALAASLLAATLAWSQPATVNPMSRGDHGSLFFGAIHGAPALENPSGIGRPPNRYVAVTPVPEPSRWLMMLAGLGIVGFIVRRSATRS
jgi:hypothetical protein